jgi:all-trans-retinol 13,14-reductase
VCLYLGFDGDIAAAGASGANVWVYESEDIGRIWQQPESEDAPGFFVSFPSLKDPDRRGAPTGELIAFCAAGVFAPWLPHPTPSPSAAYRALKACVERRLLAQFKRHFPGLAPLLRFHELATPVTQARYVRTPAGSLYGLEMSAARLESSALAVRTPMAGLLLAGQDVLGAGVPSACMSGLLAAAAIEPALWARFGG